MLLSKFLVFYSVFILFIIIEISLILKNDKKEEVYIKNGKNKEISVTA